MNYSDGLVTVIIPVYNGEKTIVRACRSVLEQDYPHVELVVVDDGSTDRTVSALQELKALNLVVRTQENGGVSKARNTGLEAARGEYILFLDADDELAPGCLKNLLELSKSHDCDIVSGTCLRIRPDGSSFPDPYPMKEDLKIWEGEEAFLLSLKDDPATYAVWGKLYRSAAIGDTRFVEGKKLHEDSFFLFEMLQKGLRIAVTQSVVVHYHLTDNSASRAAFSEKFLDMLYFAQRKYDIVESQYPHQIPLGKNILVKGNMALLKNMWKPGAEKYRDVEHKCQQTIRENADFFISAIRVDRVIFTAVRLHLFWLYKWAYRLWKRR